uniref:NADH dehydrogenase subunit 6 n=1 Tax=Ascidiella aspersa TaxID=201961 RepID=S0DGV6_9ASCI|nr:NADH dehydrogenase subunit 6 [Ascidiella aspersa]CCO25813.1 NADH dehydrogenase subunit 6 [Ascidiella aspersa]
MLTVIVQDGGGVFLLSLMVSFYICFGVNLFLMIMGMMILVLGVFSFLLTKNMALLGVFLVILYLGGLMVLFSYATVLSGVLISGDGDLGGIFLSYLGFVACVVMVVAFVPDFVFWIVKGSCGLGGGFMGEGGLSFLCMFYSGLLLVAGVLIITVLIFCVSLLSM